MRMPKKVVVEPSYEKSDKAFKMKLKIINNTDKKVTMQTWDRSLISAMDEKKIQHTHSIDKMFIMMIIVRVKGKALI